MSLGDFPLPGTGSTAHLEQERIPKDHASGRVAVAVPLYRKELSPLEEISLAQCRKILGRHDIVFISPRSVEITGIQNAYDINRVERFEDDCFLSTTTYNHLMLSPEFFQRFSSYDYLLVHQLDAFVFQDQLRDWCSRELDYVGAPWLGETWPERVMKSARKPLWARIPFYRRLFFKKSNIVGNGGFSLRRVGSSLRVLEVLKKYAADWPMNEDVFWSVYVPNVLPWFRVPDVRTAARFSLELQPSLGVELNGGALPFGCHAWDRWDPGFWRPHIESCGYRFPTDCSQGEAPARGQRAG